MSGRGSRLASFLNPGSIAIVGASDKGLYTAGILADLQRYGYRGRIYPVNPRRREVGGLPCFSEIGALPEVPALVIVVVGRERVLGVIDQCIALDVPAALIISAGFGESDGEGKAFEQQLRERVRGSNLAVIGPNCAGLANAIDEGMGTVVATRLPVAPQPGGVGFVSASGALMMALAGVFADLHLGVSRLISLGNQVDVALTEALEYLVDDPATRIVGAFIEGIEDGVRFRRVAHAARAAGKPLVVVKSGRTEQGQRAATTHTAALAGSDAVFQVVCREAGVVLVEDMAELTRTLHLLAAWEGKLPAGKRLALVTQSGGMGSLTADLASLHGFALPDLPASLQDALQAQPFLLSFDPYGNPADVRGAGSVGEEAATTLRIFLESDAFDVTLLLLAKSAVAGREVATAQALAALARETQRPFALVWVGQQLEPESGALAESRRILSVAGVPVFEQSGDALRALAKVCEWRSQSGVLCPQIDPLPEAVGAEARWLGWEEGCRLLEENGIAVSPWRVAADADDAMVAADALGYPVVAKLLASAHTHKSDAGLVRLNLRDADALREAIGEMSARVPEHEGILLQPMATPGVEALIGVSFDAQFGPVIACGVGGVLVELLGDVALRLPPLDPRSARVMLDETKLGRLLAGVRGKAPADRDALVKLLVGVATLAQRSGAHLQSLDMNPVIVHEQGLSIVDLRIAWKE